MKIVVAIVVVANYVIFLKACYSIFNSFLKESKSDNAS